MRRTLTQLARAAALCTLALFASVAFAETFPSRPVTLIVPFPAGGSADVVSRSLARELSERWKQPVVVINRPGGGTLIGLNAIATAPADGYTIGMNSISHVVQPAVRAKLPFDPLNDFTFISEVLEAPFVLTVNSSLPIKSEPDLIAYMKANPGKANFASFGVGSAGHIFFEILLQHTGTEATHVPYKGTGEATMAQLNGDAPLMFDIIMSPMPHIKSGKLRALMVTTAKRSKDLPDVPTSRELGIPALEMPTWFGLVGPKGLAPDTLVELNAAVRAAMQSPAFLSTIEAQGMTATPSTPAEFKQFVDRSIKAIGTAATLAKIQKVDD